MSCHHASLCVCIYIYIYIYILVIGRLAYIRLRHCATNRKVEGSIPYDVIDNLSGRSMALESTQPLTEMSTRDIAWG